MKRRASWHRDKDAQKQGKNLQGLFIDNHWPLGMASVRELGGSSGGR